MKDFVSAGKVLTASNYEIIPLNSRTNVRFYTSVDQGSYVAPHWHDAIEIVCLQEGDLTITVEQTVHKMQPGQCLMISPNRVHATVCTSPNRAIVFQIPEPFFRKFIPDAERLEFCLQDPAATPVAQSKVDIFKDILAKMQYLADHAPDGAVLRFNSLLFEVLFQLYHNFSVPVAPSAAAQQSKNLERLKPVLDYTLEHYNQPISLETISGIALFEPKYFCRFFKKYMGLTFHEYQSELRLARIYEDLLSTTDRISDLLERHGFTNEKLFRRMFRERFHAAPMELRRRREDELEMSKRRRLGSIQEIKQ